jgi:hypothetical protein
VEQAASVGPEGDVAGAHRHAKAHCRSPPCELVADVIGDAPAAIAGVRN